MAETYLTTLKYCTKFAFEDVPGRGDDPRHAEPGVAAVLGENAGVDFHAAGRDFFCLPMHLGRSAVLGAEDMERSLRQVDAEGKADRRNRILPHATCKTPPQWNRALASSFIHSYRCRAL